ncbi:dipeptidase [Tateyamaria sp.]|uniref:dipeptidase n=1 Tax=Tateyamaria sp. TaxID=1929288 RepID=UPI0032A0154D
MATTGIAQESNEAAPYDSRLYPDSTFSEITPPDKAQFEMRPRPGPEETDKFPEYIQYLVDVAEPRSQEELDRDDPYMMRYTDALNLDSLFIGAPGFPAGYSTEEFEAAIQESIDNNFDAVSLTMSNGSDASVEEVIQRFKDMSNYIAENPSRYRHITSIEDFLITKSQGKIGIHYNFQSMNALDGNLKNIQMYYDLGLRQMNFTYNVDNEWGAGGQANNGDPLAGVTELGFDAIREMNRLGIVIDCSHSANQTCIDAAVASTKPIIMSHSNVAVLQPIPRNASDQAIQAVAAGGGAVCLNFIGGFLNPHGLARPYDIAKHVEYVGNLVGREHVCSGSDYVFNYADTLEWILLDPVQFPVESGYATPSQMGKPQEVWGVARVLEERFGWSGDEIRGFLGENVLRVYRANWTE